MNFPWLIRLSLISGVLLFSITPAAELPPLISSSPDVSLQTTKALLDYFQTYGISRFDVEKLKKQYLISDLLLLHLMKAHQKTQPGFFSVPAGLDLDIQCRDMQQQLAAMGQSIETLNKLEASELDVGLIRQYYRLGKRWWHSVALTKRCTASITLMMKSGAAQS